MNWYEKLNQYFPIEEMKSKEHIEILLTDKQEIYKKMKDLTMFYYMWKGMSLFSLITYLFPRNQGAGVRKKTDSKVAKRQKTILLEVEPVQEHDDDTLKRLRFYKREGFKHASSISYSRKSLATKEDTPMEILYWPSDSSIEDEDVFNFMKEIYSEIHTYKDNHLYGKSYQNVEDVLSISMGHETDIFEEISMNN